MYPRMSIQNFLNSFGSLDNAHDALRIKHGINVKEELLVFDSGVAETVYLYNSEPLKWKTIGSMRYEANGLILNGQNDIVSSSYRKFFGMNDLRASELDFSDLSAERYLDGTLVVVYSYGHDFFIQTKKSVMALDYLPGTDETYYRAVLRVLNKKFDGKPFQPFLGHQEFSKRYSWAFEYVNPKDGEEDLILLSAFRKDIGGLEVQPHYLDRFAKQYGFKRPPRFEGIRSKEAAYELMEDCCSPFDKGLIVFDRALNRRKLLNPIYKTLKKIINCGEQTLPKHFAEIVLTGEAEKVGEYFPKCANILLLMDEVLQEILEDLTDMWAFHGDLESRKEFAAMVKNHSLSCILFETWDGKLRDFDDACQKINPYYLVEETRKRHAEIYRRALEEALKAEETGTEEGNTRYA